jgi:hypothetical protein
MQFPIFFQMPLKQFLVDKSNKGFFYILYRCFTQQCSVVVRKSFVFCWQYIHQKTVGAKKNHTLDHPGETIIAVRCARYTLPFVHHFCVTQGHPTWLMATSAWFFLRQHQGLELRDESTWSTEKTAPYFFLSLGLLVYCSQTIARQYNGNSNQPFINT